MATKAGPSKRYRAYLKRLAKAGRSHVHKERVQAAQERRQRHIEEARRGEA